MCCPKTPRATGDDTSTSQLIDDLDAAVVQLGRLFTARHGEMCCESGLSPAQALVLRILSEHGSVRVGELGSLLGVKAPAASSLIDAIEKRGLIAREHDSTDRRIIHVALTDEGSTALAEAEAQRREHMRRFVSVLSEDDARTLLRIHRKLIEAMLSGLA